MLIGYDGLRRVLQLLLGAAERAPHARVVRIFALQYLEQGRRLRRISGAQRDLRLLETRKRGRAVATLARRSCNHDCDHTCRRCQPCATSTSPAWPLRSHGAAPHAWFAAMLLVGFFAAVTEVALSRCILTT